LTFHIREIDQFVHYIYEELKRSKMTNQTNLIITSDHGMTNINRGKSRWTCLINKCIRNTDVSDSSIINLDRYIDPTLYRWSGRSIFPESGWVTCKFQLVVIRSGTLHFLVHDTQLIYEKLLDFQHEFPHFEVYRKNDDVPANLHYKNSDRIGPIILLEHHGYSILSQGETLSNSSKNFLSSLCIRLFEIFNYKLEFFLFQPIYISWNSGNSWWSRILAPWNLNAINFHGHRPGHQI